MKFRFAILAMAIMLATQAQAIQASFWYANFNTPANKPYIETYISILGSSAQFNKNEFGKYQALIEVSLLFKQNNEIREAKKYTLLSPEITDTLQAKPNFIDQQRISLPPGTYNVELTINDKNKPGKPLAHTQDIKLEFDSTAVVFSDVQLLESYAKSTAQGPLTKSGFDLVPYVSNYFPHNMDKLRYYSEIYNTSKVLGANQKIMVVQYIENADRKSRLEDFSNFSKQNTAEVNVILSEFNIEPLPTGNYNLVMEVRDKENKLITQKKTFIIRVKKQKQMGYALTANNDSLRPMIHFASYINNMDTLKDYIRCLWPISSESEKTFADNQLQIKDKKNMQNFLYSFWFNRDNVNPERAWLTYLAEVKKVNKEFGAMNKKGYETDRGRVYLQYGAPDQLGDYPFEPSAYPYQIWMYYKLQSQGQRKFIFYNNSFQTNDYRLLHSDARGEINDPNWEIKLNQRNTMMPNGGSQERNSVVPDQFGGRSKDVFRDPR